MAGFKDSRNLAERLLAPKKPLSRQVTGLSSLKLNLGGSPAPGVLNDMTQIAGPIRNGLTTAIKNKILSGKLAAALTTVLSGFDAQLKKVKQGDVTTTATANTGLPDVASFLTFSTLPPGRPMPASFDSIVEQRRTQLQQLTKSFAATKAASRFSGVSLVENTTPSTYPLPEDLDKPDIPPLAQGGAAAQADPILKDKIKFAAHGVTIGTGKPHSWLRLLTDAAVAAVPTLNKTVGQIFKDRKNSGTWSEPVTAYAAQFPYNHVQQTESGHVIELDDTPGAERVHIFHRSGSFVEMHPNGDVVYKTMKDGYRVTMANEHVKISGDCHVSIDGRSTVYVKGNADMQVDGDFNVQTKGDYNVYADNINMRAKKTFKGDGAHIDLRYISLPFNVMPVSYGLAPIGFAPRVNMTAVDLDTGVQHGLPEPVPSDPDNVPFIADPTVASQSVTVPPENPLSNWSVYTATTPEAISYRSKLFDTPEEVGNIELYAGHVGLQQTLGDLVPDNRQLGGKLVPFATKLVEPNTKPVVNYLDFSTFKGTYSYANDYVLAGTSFTLADVSDLALHPAVVQDTLTPGSLEPIPADALIPRPGNDGGPAPVIVEAPAVNSTPLIITPPDFNVAVFNGATSIQPPNVLYSNGTVILDGAVLETPSTYSAPYTLNFTAKFDGSAFQHIGFATDLSAAPWAIISTGGGSLPLGIYARTNPTVGVPIDELIGTTALYGAEHDFRIEWTSTGFTYYIDGVQKTTHSRPETTPMKILGSDPSHDSSVITITVLDELTL
jgi:hypothetical protein